MVSSKVNATRKRANVIVMHKNAQFIFIDTPGLHQKERLLNKFMLEEALKAIGDCDLILFLSPVTDSIDHYKEFLKLNKKNTPHIILLTKVDLVDNKLVLQKINEFSKFDKSFLELIPVSTKKPHQEYLLDILIKYIPSHPYFYNPEIITTENIKDIYKELIRESIFENMSKEIPYFSDVVIEKVEELPKIEKIYAQIIVEKKSQKGVIIGKDGASLRRIGKVARISIENFINKKVFLKLFVVVKPSWSKDKKFLSKLGYNID